VRAHSAFVVDEAGHGQHERGLAGSARSDQRVHLARPGLQPLVADRDRRAGGAVEPADRPLDGDVGGVEGDDVGPELAGGEQTSRYAAWFRRRVPRHPDPLRHKRMAVLGEHGHGRPVSRHRTIRVEHDEAVRELEPRSEAVLDDDRGQPPGGHDLGDARADRGGVVGVEHGGRLVEEEQGRLEGECSREREPLLLTAGQRVRRGVLRHVESNRGERGGDVRRHLRTRHTDVLEAERDVTADRRGHDAGAGLLQHQAHRARACTRRDAVEAHRTGQLARVGGLEDAGERTQQRGLARAARPDEQDPLARRDVEVETTQDGLAPPERAPRQVTDRDLAVACRGTAGGATDVELLRQRDPPGPPAPAGTR
jgi:hypothetical protein